VSPSTPTRTATPCSSGRRRGLLAGRRDPADFLLNISKILDVAARSGADAVHPGTASWLRTPSSPGGDRRRTDLIGPPRARSTPSATRSRPGTSPRRSAPRRSPATPNPVADAAEVVAFAEQLRPADRDQGGVRRWWPRHEGGPDHGRGAGAVRVRDPRGDQRLRSRRVLRRAVSGQAAARRDPVPGRCPRQRRGDLHPRLLTAAPLPEAVEEAPAPFLSAEQIETLYKSSKAILREAGYVGAGRASS